MILRRLAPALALALLLAYPSVSHAARLWSSGFEVNTTSSDTEWDTTAGSAPSIQSTARTGSYAMRVNSLVSGTAKGLVFRHISAEGTAHRYFRFYFRVDTYPSAANRIAVWNDAATAASPTVYLDINSTGVLRLFDEDGQIGSDGPTLSTGQWYRIEVKINTVPASGSDEVEARVDGAAAFATSSTRAIATSNDQFVIQLGGNLGAEAQTTGDFYFDDVAINDNTGSFQTGYPGAGNIIHLLPDGAGDASDWTGSYADVDDAPPPDSGGTLVTSNTLNHVDQHTLAATPSGLDSGATITVVQAGVVAAGVGSSANASFKMQIKAGGTAEEAAAAYTPSNTAFLVNSPSYPRLHPVTLYDLPGASTTAWTKSDLDSAQIGYTLSAASTNGARLTAVWLLVDYVPAAAASTIGPVQAFGCGISVGIGGGAR